ncbi:hypothetical protein GJAV_G00085770 [Gymnothorax javanicus]|nr:hypothetical protein GJAV_G00085770 [Gymnothorax javanicus]
MHENHKMRPIKEAAANYKEELEKALGPLKKKLEAFTKAKKQCASKAEFIKSEAECTVMLMREEFERLHQFLRNEEAARIAAIREEEELHSLSMTVMIEDMTKEISSLSDSIRALEQEIKAEDVSFLQNYKATKKRAKYKVSDPEKVSGGHIDVVKHLGNLKYQVWEKMHGIVEYSMDLDTEESNAAAKKALQN